MAIFSKGEYEDGQSYSSTSGGSSSASNSSASSETTVIARGAAVKGEFAFECRLHVDGDIEGTINSSNIVVIGKKGVVKGELKAQKLVVNGVFEGSADCAQVEVLTGGMFSGDVLSEELVIESKAKFQGQSKIRTIEEQKSSAAIPVIEPLENDTTSTEKQEFTFSSDALKKD